MPCD
ncbi:uncharacterized protein FFNC_06265 [Fusarium fujikuroi]